MTGSVGPTDTPTAQPTPATETPGPTFTPVPSTTGSPTATPPPGGAILTDGLGSDGDQTLSVDDLRPFPNSGVVQIEDERIAYDGKQPAEAATAGLPGAPQPGALLIVERGANGTTPAAHPPGALVTLVEPVSCPGDCNTDGRVSVNELIAGVNIALGRSDLATCTSMDRDDNGTVAVNELIVAVNRALSGCPRR